MPKRVAEALVASIKPYLRRGSTNEAKATSALARRIQLHCQPQSFFDELVKRRNESIAAKKKAGSTSRQQKLSKKEKRAYKVKRF
ncbi:MAG TPA: hypothetical protein VFE17_00845 [Candidatus Baltobacteraceae bacterium]|jgi:hypothetical protein|nr:hypothetical protein [Candidatus Baltobacteraceae bacterium]